MGMLDNAKDMYKLQKQAKQIKSELKNIHVEAESNGAMVVVDGEQQIVSISLPDELMGSKAQMEKALIEAGNKAIKKSQLIGAEKMKSMMGGMGGMFGS